MKNIFTWLVKLICAGIMLQTLWFKFTGAPESVYIFTALGVEPWGRYGLGFIELIASLLILNPKTTNIGAIVTVGLMMGAIMSHLTVIGIDVNGDGGVLFSLAVIELCLALTLVYLTCEKTKQLILLIKQKFQ